MDLEKNAKAIQECWFCGRPLPRLKRANQGYLTGNHAPHCPLEQLAAAGEQCIILRNDDDQPKRRAEQTLSEKIDALFRAMTNEKTPRCPFPICNYAFEIGHRLECHLESLRDARQQNRG